MSQPVADILPVRPQTGRPLTHLPWSLFAQAHPAEATGMLLMATNIFVLLGAYYLLKTVPEALILTEGGAEVEKSYSSAGQALLLLLLVPAYGALASHVNGMRLISFVTIFFAASFGAVCRVGIVRNESWRRILPLGRDLNVLIVAQFWAFANDAYKPEEGKRLFPFIGIGGSLGAIAGAQFAKPLMLQMGPYWVMTLVAAALVFSLLLTQAANRRVCAACPHKAQTNEERLGKEGGFQLILRTRYLLLIALLVLVLNIVNTTGEYVSANRRRGSHATRLVRRREG